MLGLSLVALTLATPDAMAEDKVKRLSISLSAGVRPDMASLGDTIVQDGTVDTSDSTIANLLYNTDKALMSDRNNMVLWYNTQNTDSTFLMLGEDPVTGGALLGMEFGGDVRYELDDVINFPLFIEAGFYYTTSISGGHQERVLGDAAAENEDLQLLLPLNGMSGDDFVGGKMVTDYAASWYEIPVSLGVKVPVKRDYSFAYGSVGFSYFNGGFEVGMDIDEKYANALATHVTDLDEAIPTVTNLSPGAVVDTITFSNSGIGLNYGLGVQVGMKNGTAFFVEYNGSGTSGTVYSSKFKKETAELLTATSSKTLAENDADWFKKLAFPVVTTGATARVGIRYYAF